MAILHRTAEDGGIDVVAECPRCGRGVAFDHHPPGDDMPTPGEAMERTARSIIRNADGRPFCPYCGFTDDAPPT